jgi:NDP-sugar pyrophosphorylase family protein
VYDALLASRPGAGRGVRTDARFYDVGTTADYWGTSWALAGRAGASAEREVAASVLGRRVRVDASAVVSGSLLWDDVEVGAGCRIEDCIVTDGVRVPPHTRWRRRILRVDNGCGLAPREAIEHGLVVSPLEVPQPTGCR